MRQKRNIFVYILHRNKKYAIMGKVTTLLEVRQGERKERNKCAAGILVEVGI